MHAGILTEATKCVCKSEVLSYIIVICNAF